MKLDAGVGGRERRPRRQFFLYFLASKASKKIYKIAEEVDERPGVEASTIFREVSFFLINIYSIFILFLSPILIIFFFHVFRKPYDIGVFYYLFYFFFHKIPACPHLCNFALSSPHQRGSREDVEKMRDEFLHFVCQRNFLYYYHSFKDYTWQSKLAVLILIE